MEKVNQNKELKAKFLEYYRDLPVQKLAAEFIGKCEDTITDWKKADSDFSDQIMMARATWAMKASKGIRSKEWLLERVMRDHFSPRSELTGANSDPLVIVTRPILGGLSEDSPQTPENVS